MQLEDYFDFLATDDIRVRGSRIGIETILYDYVYRNRTPDEIAQTFPTLTLEQVFATILYYLHNREAVSLYLADWLEFGRRAREDQASSPPPVVLRLRQERAKQVAGAEAVPIAGSAGPGR